MKRLLSSKFSTGALLLFILLLGACSQLAAPAQPAGSQPALSQSSGNSPDIANPFGGQADAVDAVPLDYREKPLEFTVGPFSDAENYELAMDRSGSMNDKDCGRETLTKVINGTNTVVSRNTIAQDAANVFIEQVPAEHNIGLAEFHSNRVTELVPLGTQNRAELKRAIDALHPNGGTPLDGAVRTGVDKLRAQRLFQQLGGGYSLILITDGEPTDGNRDLTGAIDYASKFNIPVYVAGFCLSETHTLAQLVYKYQEAANFEELSGFLQEVIAEADLPPSIN